jgi:hypothetical protein
MADSESAMEGQAVVAAPVPSGNAWICSSSLSTALLITFGLLIPGLGIADLSLRGARIINARRSIPSQGDVEAVPLWLPSPARALISFSSPARSIAASVAQERAGRGWHLTPPAPDFVRTFRATRFARRRLR